MNMKIITWDTENKGSTVELSNNNLTARIPNRTKIARASIGKSSGKWYWEIYIDALGSNGGMIGIVSSTVDLDKDILNTREEVRLIYSTDGKKYPENTVYSSSYETGDTIGIAVDLEVGNLEFYKNGESFGVSHTNIKEMGEIFPALSSGSSTFGNTSTANFGATPFNYPIPEGYQAYQTTHKTLLQSNNKTYSIKNYDGKYDIKMTSNTTPAPYVASASSVSDSARPAFKAFDGITNTNTSYWATAFNVNTKPLELTLDFGEGKIINNYKITSSLGAVNLSPKNWTLQGSDNGIHWSLLDKRTDISWTQRETKEFSFMNFKKYRMVKMVIEENNGGSLIHIDEILFGCNYYKLIYVPISSKNNFIKYGKPLLIELSSILTNKDYILQDTVSENEDGLWTTRIDRKPLSIRIE